MRREQRGQVSLWWDQLPPAESAFTRPALLGDLSIDVAIVGAGFTGLWTAYYLKRLDPTARIAVIEAEFAGFGASGRNGGWVSSQFPVSMRRIARDSGAAAATAMQGWLHESVDEIGSFCKAQQLDCYVKSGNIRVARSKLDLQEAYAEVADMGRLGFTAADYRVIDAAETRELAGISGAVGASWTPHCALIQPAMLVRGLARAVEDLGVTIYENTRASSVQPRRIHTSSGTIVAEKVVLATEAFTPDIAGYKRAIMPVYSLMIATEPLPDDILRLVGLRERPAFATFQNVIVYGQRTADGRIAFGGRGAPYHWGSAIRAHYDTDDNVRDGLRQILNELLPPTTGFEITHHWGGPVGIPRDWFPAVRYDPATGFGTCGGYVGDGVALSNLGGRTLASMIVGDSTELTSLPWVNRKRRNWEPEPFRWIGANAGVVVASSADKVEARTGKTAKRMSLLNKLTGH